MLPEVVLYLATIESAKKEYDDWYKDIQSRRPTYDRYYATWRESDRQTAYEKWNTDFYEENTKRKDARRATCEKAYIELGRVTTDPVVRWLVKNLSAYPTYVNEVLPILPATREQLEDLANTHEWCDEFDSFLEQATEAGLIPPPVESSSDAGELITWISEEYDVYERRIRRRIQGMVDEIVAKALADKEAENAAKHNEMVTA